MTVTEPVARQLHNELASACNRLTTVLGLDLDDDLRRRVRDRTPALAAQICASSDDQATAQIVVDLLNLLWPGGDPPHDWWRTPVGRMCARSLGQADSDAVTHAVAAAMLGIARGTVGTLVTRGKLDRHPDGGITRASVLNRIASHKSL